MAKRPAAEDLINKVPRRDPMEDALQAARMGGMRDFADALQCMFRKVAPQLAAAPGVSRTRYDELREAMSTSLCVEEGGPMVGASLPTYEAARGQIARSMMSGAHR